MSPNEQRGRRRFDALPIYLMLEGASALVIQLVVTIYVVYYAQTVGLDALQIVLIGTAFEGTIFLFEIPTGVVADVYSRRLSVIVGVALTGVALLVEGLIPQFGAILLAEVVAGIGATFMSGATEADHGEIRRSARRSRLRARRAGQAGRRDRRDPPERGARQCAPGPALRGVGGAVAAAGGLPDRLHAGDGLPADAKRRAGDVAGDARRRAPDSC
ncbi:MAG: hypothetical protein U0703_21170 [Anaerolineae bacterium]